MHYFFLKNRLANKKEKKERKNYSTYQFESILDASTICLTLAEQ